MATTDVDACPPTMARSRSFHMFPYLHEDIKTTVLSFLADAPFEEMPENYLKSSLTHSLPQVSKKFRTLASSDLYWKEAVVRQLVREPFLWKEALRKMNSSSRSNENVEEEKENSITAEELAQETFASNEYASYKSLYQNVVTKYLRYKGPVFHMEGQLCLGDSYSVHFEEPRYRHMIAAIMDDYPIDAKTGGHIRNPPVFVHANRGPLSPTTPATLVQVVRCEIFADGRADVVLLPTAYTWIEKLWVSSHSGGLVCAQCLRMDQATTHSMNQLARQEALTMMMDQMVGNLRRSAFDFDQNLPMDSESDSSSSSSGSSGSSSSESD